MAWEPQKWPKSCSCGRSYTKEQWLKLHLVGTWDDEEESILEMRNCTCNSSMSVKLRPRTEKVRSLRAQALKWQDLVALADKLATKDEGLRFMLREVDLSKWCTHRFLGSSRAPTFAELLSAVQKAGHEQGLW